MVFAITVMLRQYLAESAGHFRRPAEFVNAANPDFENLRHLQNPGQIFLTAPSIVDLNLGKGTN